MNQIAATAMDVFPTLAEATAIEARNRRIFDGRSLAWPGNRGKVPPSRARSWCISRPKRLSMATST